MRAMHGVRFKDKKQLDAHAGYERSDVSFGYRTLCIGMVIC